MPRYDYNCPKCQLEVEHHADFFDTATPNCPECKTAMVKQFKPTPVHFKGGGWGGRA